MVQKRNTDDDSEKFAKNWRVDGIAEKIEEYKESNEKGNNEIKGMIKTLDTKIENKVATKEELKNAINLVHETYGPTKKAVWWLAGTLALIVISYFFQLFINLSQVVSK